jgi:hypothetical protein
MASALRYGTDWGMRASHHIQYLGRAGFAGIALILLAALGFVAVNAHLHQQGIQLQRDLAILRHEAGKRPLSAAAAPTRELQVFLRKLPARSQLPTITERIVAQAAAAGVLLERGSYEVSTTPSGRVVRARLSFPVHGAYGDIRRFVDLTLAAVPAAGVDGLRLERKNIGATEIAADIRFAVFLRNEP